MSVPVLRSRSSRKLLNPALVIALACALSASPSAQLLFGPPTSTALGGPAATSVAAGDVNGDFLADLVIGHAGAPGLRLNVGNGQFGPEAPIAVGASGSTVLLADVTNDSRPDLFVGSSLTGSMSVAVCKPDGSFEPADSYTLGLTTSGLDTLSLNVRSSSVIGVTSSGVLAVTPGAVGITGGEARIFRTDDDGDLELMGVITPALPNRVVGGQVGSLNDDDLPDVVLQLDAGTTSPALTVSAYVGQAGGGFLPTWSLGDAALGCLGSLTVGRGGLDLLTLGSSGGVAAITSHYGMGDGTFVTTAISEIETTSGVSISAVSDLDQNYINDLVAVRQVPAELWVMRALSDGSGGFEMDSRVTLAPGTPLLAAGAGLLGDFNEGGGINMHDAVVPVGLGTASPSVGVCFNLTYPGGVLQDLGHQLKGTNWPIQVVEGSFVAGQPFSFRLSGAAPSAPAVLIAGLTLLEAPFKGGVMLPKPFLITGPLPVSTAGELTLSGAAWPGGPFGLDLFLQFWIADPAGPAGFAASSGVQVTLP